MGITLPEHAHLQSQLNHRRLGRDMAIGEVHHKQGRAVIYARAGHSVLPTLKLRIDSICSGGFGWT